MPLIGAKLVKLTQSSVGEQDIINIATVFEKYVAGIDRQSAIQTLTKESDSLRKEVGSLQTEKRDSSTDNQRILRSLFESRHAYDLLYGSTSSLRNEILGLVSIAAYIPYLMKF